MAVDEGTAPDGRRYVHAPTRASLRRWLAKHQDDGAGAWLVSWKKATGRPAVPYNDLVEELLCVGWVDSTAGTLDAERGMLWCAPRKRRSGWSRPNKERVARLEEQGLLLPRGIAVIEEAKADGSWSKLDEVEDGIEPDDLRAALDADPLARQHWDAFPRSVKRGLLELVAQAKKQETRDRRIATIVSDAHDNSRGPFQRKPSG
ncbi:MAG: YdeI/OmpD-associated family protein [Candidatus Nanopelagicales bacterium]